MSSAPLTPDRPPELLFHYTSAAGALGILQAGSVRASMIHYMNDGQELKYALDLVAEMVLEGSGAGESEPRFRSAFKDLLRTIQNYAVFAFSLSEERDLLSQWRSYCPPEGGYALGFLTSVLGEVAAPYFQLVRFEYARDKQAARLQPITDRLLRALRDASEGANFMDAVAPVMVDLVEVGASIKHPSFAEEREWRLIASGVRHDSIRFRTAGSLIVPYLELPIAGGPRFPVERVVIGPHRHSYLAGRALRLLASTARGWPVKVEETGTPFRLLG